VLRAIFKYSIVSPREIQGRKKKEITMRRKSVYLGLFTAVITITALYHARTVLATPAQGFTGTTLAVGKFDKIDVFNAKVLEDAGQWKKKKKLWLSWQRTKGTSDLYVQSNVWQPGGSTGWHTHPGHSLIIVTAGKVTTYDGDDPNCKPQVHEVGEGFVDAGGDHVHNIRNEGDVAATTIAVQLIPARVDGSSSAADRRVDVANPGNCPF
jgi:quercetin dioxygenase-like cupin family protein